MLLAATLASACQASASRGGSPPDTGRVASHLPAIPTTTTTTATTAEAIPPPPYAVATSTLALVDTTRPTVRRGVRISPSRALTTMVWSPVVPGPHPLVLFAAGYDVGPSTYDALCRAWATAGYIVAAPEFPLADPAVAGAAVDENDLDNEPADALFVLASLVAPGSPLAGAIDPTRIGVAGHSDGAEVALALAQQGNRDVKAVIAMSGQPVVPHLAPNPPLLVVQGDQDTVNPPGRSAAVYAQATPPRFLLTLLGAGHLPPFAGGTAWQPVVEATTTDFLRRYLAGATISDGELAVDGNRPGLSNLQKTAG